MGGYMQPQGHVQLLVRVLNYQLDVQRAIDAPRFCIEAGTGSDDARILIEDGVDAHVVDELRKMGHPLKLVKGAERMHFGRGQMIIRDEDGVLWAGSDGRADGAAVGY
jgi:gamma-glutamyltranspeptidase/glutathione hydrolase